jgi:hypothetical protein
VSLGRVLDYGLRLADFFVSLPDILAGRELRAVVHAIVEAKRKQPTGTS